MKSIIALLALFVASANAAAFAKEAVKASRSTFPFCACDESTSYSPFALTRFREVRQKKSVKLCWRIKTTAWPAGSGACSKFDLRKVEINMKPECRGSVVSASFNKAPLSISYADYPEISALALKVLRPDAVPIASFKALKGKTPLLCIEVKKGACGSAAKFCVGESCNWSIFSSDLKCCPTGM